MSNSNALAEEIEALKSIYEKDLTCDGSNIIITLFPLREKEKEEIYSQLDLYVICPDSYPKKEPDLHLRNVKGLSHNQIGVLYSKLKELAKSLVGNVMIYNLAYFVQEFLLDNTKPEKKSCYEEMILRREQEKQEEYESEVYKKTKLIENIQEKQKELQSTECDSYESSDEEEKVDVSHASLANGKVRSNSLVVKDEMPCEHKNCKYIQFHNKVLRGCCIEHDTNSIIYCAIDSSTGDQLLLQEWVFKPKNRSEETLAFIRQKLESIQSALGNLKRICHENLISYIDFKKSLEKGDWYVHVLQEYITGNTLSMLLERSVDLDLNFIRHVINGVLTALNQLHMHRVIHGSVNESCIYFSKSGIVKVGNYGVKKLLDNLHESCKFENLPQIKNKISEKSDILEVGFLILRIMKLSLIPNENIMVPDFEPPELKDFVEKCLIENEENRWTARKLLTHKFLKIRDSRPSLLRKKLSKDDSGINEDENEKPYSLFFERSQIVNSRLAKEFKILNHIGTGSFGKVLKVKNKLDGSVYAIKAIRLSMKNKQLDKKMIREVKLLSKLNHENIVRYYTSWIETNSEELETSLMNKDTDVVDGEASNKITKSNAAIESEDDDEDEDDEDDDDEEEEEEDEEEDVTETDSKSFQVPRETEQSSYIVFLKDHSKSEQNEETEEDKCVEMNPKLREPDRTMYIQMEFCEKSTLRIAINDSSALKLCDDETRLWRLFREIVEGLAYVHNQGMIHRDLKPENIFLDSSDHVKIGDFGLATISVVSKPYFANLGPLAGGGDHDASSRNIYDDFHTGKVGTSLYVAPELDRTYEKSYYNEKVDIYSLGIIFFEMCNGPFTTDMERIETLLNLRKFEIILPPFWDEKLYNQRNLIKMLLKHDPKSRPSCQEILEGDYLPPAEFEYEQFQEILSQTLINPKSKAYKYLVSSCFEQEVRIEDDVTYQSGNVRSEKQHFILDLVKERLEKIFKKHGAIYLSAPLLLPQNKENRNVESLVQLMTHSGSIVSLPYDLRTSFARYVACKAVTRLRRYVVERVYREKKVHGLHPKEQYECAFDLITPPSGAENAKIELMCLIQEIVNDFKSLKSRNCVIRFNHSILLKTLLIHFNLEKWYSDIFKILSDAHKNKYFKSKLESNVQRLGIHLGSALLNLLTKEDSFNNIKKELLLLINKRGKTLDMLNRAFEELSAVIGKAERLGIKLPIKLALGVVCYSEHCSDVMFDVGFKVKQKRKKEETLILMSGCRYDGLVARFRKLFELTATSPEYEVPSAVGLSVHLDKIAAILKEDNVLSEFVVVCSFNNNALGRAKQLIAKKLWESGIKCYVEETIETLEELTEYCRENKIMHIVNLKDEESGVVYVMTWDKERDLYLEKKITIRDLTEHILKHSKTTEEHQSPVLMRLSSEPQGRTVSDVNGSQNVNIQIISLEKLASTQRRRWENQLRTRISTVASLFSIPTRLEVIGVFLDERQVKDLALNFKTNDATDTFLAGVESLWKPIKKYASKICLKLRSIFSEKANAVVILYSLSQDKYHFILDS